MAFVVVEELWKVYQMNGLEVRALRGLSLTLERGELASLIGPSGSGKTTLLSIIGGLLPATSGNVKVGDLVVTGLSDDLLADYRLRGVGHIFQTLNLISFLSAAENIALPMIALGVPAQERTERVQELLRAMDLEDRRHHRPHELSGGEQQRVAIAAALANDPPLILADEPTGELDSETAQEIVSYLKRVHEEGSKTTLLVTHDPKVAAAAKRILRIEDGRVTGGFKPAASRTRVEAKGIDRFVRTRLREIEAALKQLDVSMREGAISSDDYAAQRQELNATKQVLRNELHRLGIP